jgi:fibronectin-binding autotransporter adhesin
MKPLLHRASGCDRARVRRLCAFRGSRARVALMSGTALVGAALCVSLAVVPAFAVDVSTQAQLDQAVADGAASINVVTGNLALTGAQTFNPVVDLSIAVGASLSVAGATNNQVIGSLAGAGTLTLGLKGIAVGGDNANAAFSGTISMTNQGYNPTYGTFAKTGSGTLTIDNATITQGESYITQGAMAQTSGNTTVTYLAVGTGTTGGTPNVGTLNVSGGTISFGTALQVGDFGGQGTLNQTGGIVRVDATCGDPAHCAALHIGNQGGTGTYNISGGELDLVGSNNELGRSTGTKPPSAGTLNISGTGVVDVSANGSLIIGYGNENTSPNTSQGLIDQTGGTLRVHNGSTLYLTGANSSSSVYNLTGGTLEIGGNSLKAGYGGTPNPYQFNLGGGTIKVIESALVTTVNATLASGVSTIDTNGLGATWSGVLSGNGGLAKVGAGKLTLSGLNTYSGSTLLDAGTLAVGSNAALGTGTLTFASGTTLQAAANGLTLANTLTLNGTDTIDTQSTAMALSGSLGGTGGLAKIGTGALKVSGANTYSGETTVTAGTLQAGASNTFSAASAFTVGAGAFLDVNGFNQTIGSLAGAGTVTNNGAGAATLTAGGDNTSTTFSGTLQNGRSALGLAKTGTGTLTLSGVNTYRGGTTVNGGTLAVSSDNNLGDGSGGLAFGGGTLQFLSGFTSNRAVTLNSGGGTFDTNGNNAAWGGTIGGVGSLTKIGTGKLTLSGSNTYTGGTIINAGTLAVSADNNLGNASGGISFNGGMLQFNGSFFSNRAITLKAGGGTFDTNGNGPLLTGSISGPGGLTKVGIGDLSLAGASTYSGPTNVLLGTLAAGATSVFSPASAFTVVSGGALNLNGFNQSIGSLAGDGLVGNAGPGPATLTTGGNNSSTTFSGVIFDAPGAMSLTKAGTGTMILSGDNSYTGGTTISAGTLQLGDGGTSGSIVGNVANNGIFAVNRSDVFTFGGLISGTGAFQQNGTGTTIFTANNTYGGATTVSAGTLQAGAANTFAPSSAVTVASGATLNLANFNQKVGSLTGAGSVTLGSATLTTGNDNTSTTFSGTISGSGGLSKIGAGVLTLSGVNIYSGGTTLAGGTLSLANNQALGTGALTTTGSVVDYANGVTIANAIVINSNTTQLQVTIGTATQAGVISELNSPRPLEKIGAGALILAAANTYTGPTTVSAGTLVVNGSIASSAVTVNSGATLSGTGTVGGLTINSGGTFAPSNSPGTMTVAGNLAFQSGALYLVQVTPSTASSINVTGSATLAGTVQAAFAAGNYATRAYTILSAAGGLGGATFNTLTTSNLPAGFTASLSYTATGAILNLTANLGGGPGGPSALACAFSVNQCNVANALNVFFNNGGALPANFLPIFNLTGANLANALTLLSGEAATDGQQVGFQLTNQFLGVMLDPFVDGRSGAGGGAIGFAPERAELPEDIALAYAKILKEPPKPQSFEHRWSVWGSGYGGSNRTSGDVAVVGSHDLSARTAGGAAGLDYRLAPGTVVGFALAGGGTN